jgi:outer membrane protein assembly factor BamB
LIVLKTLVMTAHTLTFKAKLVVAASVLAGLAACGSNKLPPAPLADFKPSVALARQWLIAADSLNATPSVIKAATGTQLIVSQGAQLINYQAGTGAVIWRAGLAGVQAPIGVSSDNQTLLALVQGNEVVALSASNGQVLWRNSLPAEMRVQPASVGGVFVVLTADGRIVGMDEQTGRRRWVLTRALPALSVRGTGTVTALSATVAKPISQIT